MLQLLQSTTVRLGYFKTRNEFRGDDQALAVDLSLCWTTSNRALDAFHKRLRPMLFCDLRQEAEGEQAEMDLPVDDLPNVQVPGAKYPISYPDFQQVGARVEIAYGIDDKTAIVLQLCKVSKLHVTPIEGGSAKIEFLVSSSADIDVHAVAPLLGLQQHEISIRLTMPEVEQPAKQLTERDVFENPIQDAEKEKPLTPEQVFINSSTLETEKPAAAKKAAAKKPAVGKSTKRKPTAKKG
jgi:hypothetical protein